MDYLTRVKIPEQARKYPGQLFRRTAAARRHRARPCACDKGSCCRRTHLRVGSRDDQEVLDVMIELAQRV